MIKLCMAFGGQEFREIHGPRPEIALHVAEPLETWV